MLKPINLFVKTIFITAITSTFAFHASAAPSNNKQKVEVAFVLDTTGSMAGLIDGAKQKIWSIANTIIDVNPDAEIRMALIAYRDRGDEYIIKTYDMSSDVQGLYGKLTKLEADGGGDTPESVNEALDEAVRKLEWTKGDDTKRIIFLVGDAPPHMDYPNAPLYPNVLKGAVADGIIVNTIQAGDDRETKKIWREIAQLGHGRYMPIPQDGGRITVINTPYDDQIIVIQRKIDKTVLPYGNHDEREALTNKMEEKAEAPAPVQIDNSRFYSKKSGSKEVVTGGNDLITDVKNGTQKIEEVQETSLPDELRGKSSEEKNAIVEKTSQERSKLEAEMSALIEKRDAYITEQKLNPDKDNNSFDSVVKETLHDQLK
ncbi:VWA domain-containing protein [Bartonella sp. HY329]|uniref:vWA domain-containing protein n=1 Tax=unclassified Bartonella TaxID=2645622 RepID=UPI0021C62A7A|nr:MULTISPECIES: vWA domain-containing protein [unclassified Bartonella]UXM95738.1 VWA domain-containing protein [Bartonella sp. HY329]UXN10063.1 VWA domain-containing protein [Bartonella sp. HY328]